MEPIVRLFPLLSMALLALSALACAAPLPTPLAPSLRGSIGLPHHGVLTHAVELPRQGDGYLLLRSKGARWGHPRLITALQRAAAEVHRARPGGPPLLIGDLSAQRGGRIRGHRSHRTGRDVDLLLYALTPDGRPVRAPGFLRYGRDGLAEAEDQSGRITHYRLDLERNWLLVRALVESPEAAVQWLFIARWLEALITEYARARGEDPELIWHAESVLLQPGDSAAHDDHFHLRIACTPDEAVAGCTGGGPRWPWLPALPALESLPDEELGMAILEGLLPEAVNASPEAPVPPGAAP
ncbi:MAG TPA: penicillin-insensitive murein endopeptidase [Candidatus Nanopelagicales bacterium]|nr:penicillin-insensitive murein endopeptidase [Candidatus Nanopelagicales bacterium]